MASMPEELRLAQEAVIVLGQEVERLTIENRQLRQVLDNVSSGGLLEGYKAERDAMQGIAMTWQKLAERGADRTALMRQALRTALNDTGYGEMAKPEERVPEWVIGARNALQ